MLLYTFYNINVCKFILTIFPLNPFYRNIRFTYICAYICTYVLTFRARFILYVFCILSRSMYCIYIYICTARMKVQNIKVSFSYIFISCTLMTWEYMYIYGNVYIQWTAKVLVLKYILSIIRIT